MREIMTLPATAVVGAALVAGPASAAGSVKSVQVTNAKDAGAGSFRAAVQKANADRSVGRIVFLPGLKPIALTTPVVYSGAQALEVMGTGGIVDGGSLAASAADAFLANGGGNLSVALLTIRNAPGQGLTYQVPSGATGTKKVTLTAVDRSTTDGNGQDGVEFDENGAGNLAGTASRGSAANNGAAGVRADQQVSTGDAGTLSLIAMALADNPEGNVVANAGVTVTETP